MQSGKQHFSVKIIKNDHKIIYQIKEKNTKENIQQICINHPFLWNIYSA